MLPDQHAQMGVNFLLIELTELIENNAADQDHGRKGDDDDGQNHFAGQCPIIVAG